MKLPPTASKASEALLQQIIPYAKHFVLFIRNK
jgi:hypothetical protein